MQVRLPEDPNATLRLLTGLVSFLTLVVAVIVVWFFAKQLAAWKMRSKILLAACLVMVLYVWLHFLGGLPSGLQPDVLSAKVWNAWYKLDGLAHEHPELGVLTLMLLPALLWPSRRSSNR